MPLFVFPGEKVESEVEGLTFKAVIEAYRASLVDTMVANFGFKKDE